MQVHDEAETPPAGGLPLATGGLAAVLASTCCLGPLVLLGLGLSGPWLVHLTSLERYQPVFVAATVLALGIAWRRIWRPVAACEPQRPCAAPRVRQTYKILFVVVSLLLLVSVASPLVAPWFY